MPKKVPYYSNDRKLFPMTKTEYVKRGSRWVPVSTETEMISRRQAGYVLTRAGFRSSVPIVWSVGTSIGTMSRMIRFRPSAPTVAAGRYGTSIGRRGMRTMCGLRGRVPRRRQRGSGAETAGK